MNNFTFFIRRYVSKGRSGYFRNKTIQVKSSDQVLAYSLATKQYRGWDISMSEMKTMK